MMINEKDLQLILKSYSDNQINDSVMLQVFHKLAEEVLAKKSYCTKPEIIKKKAQILQETAEFCLAKVEQYNGKTKAFNFFVTIISCYLGQLHGMLRNYEKRKG